MISLDIPSPARTQPAHELHSIRLHRVNYTFPKLLAKPNLECSLQLNKKGVGNNLVRVIYAYRTNNRAIIAEEITTA
jgi:hypothetical protein